MNKIFSKLFLILLLVFFILGFNLTQADTVDTSIDVSSLSAPANLTAIVISANQIDLNWSAVLEAVSYKVYRDGAHIVSPATTSYSNTGLSSGTAYSYTISAVNIFGGESPQSSSVSATTLSAPGGGIAAAWFMPPQPPVGGFRILVNNGAKYTDNLIISLKLFGGPDTARMAISNNPEFTGLGSTGQIAYQSQYSWDICRGRPVCPEGKYTVYVKFFTSWGTASEAMSDSIIYRIKPIIERIRQKLQQKLIEITERITILKNQIAQLFPPPEEVVSEEIPPEEIPLPIEEPPIEEIITPPEEIAPLPEEVAKVGPIEILKEYGKWLWQQITSFWQKIWPF